MVRNNTTLLSFNRKIFNKLNYTYHRSKIWMRNYETVVRYDKRIIIDAQLKRYNTRVISVFMSPWHPSPPHCLLCVVTWPLVSLIRGRQFQQRRVNEPLWSVIVNKHVRLQMCVKIVFYTNKINVCSYYSKLNLKKKKSHNI